MGSSAIEGVPTLGSGGGAVTSVAARTGDVVLTAADVGAGQLPAGVLLPAGVAIPSGASAATQAANDNSTKVATTAYADAIAALKANLASPTFTGSPFLPTGTTGVTQSINDGTTALATDLYVDKSLNGAWAFPVSAVAATQDRSSASIAATRTVTTAQIFMTALYIPKGVVVSNFNAISAATSSVGTHCWFALFNNSRVQLATTADDTSAAAFTADTTKTQAVATIASGASATFTTTYSGLHYVGLCVVFTGTAPTIRCTAVNSIIGGVAPIMQGSSNAAQTAPNAFAFTANALTATANRDYIWLT